MRLYNKNDMVKAGCHDCKGCSECCRGMGDTIILDPLDIRQLTVGLKAGRCNIHTFRPGLCRAFPLGRSYEEGKLHYFLLEDCPAQNKTKVKIDKWIHMPEFSRYEKFLTEWHFFLKSARTKAQSLQAVQGEGAATAQAILRSMNLYS